MLDAMRKIDENQLIINDLIIFINILILSIKWQIILIHYLIV